MSDTPSAPIFLCEELHCEVTAVNLSGDEATHAARSRRLGEGDLLHLTNGKGLLGKGTIKRIERKPDRILVELDSIIESPEPAIDLVLASALPKGDRMNTLLDMATQLGMTAFQPLDCARSVVQFQSRSVQRWQRIIASAAKQCRQTRFPEIRQETTPEQLVEKLPDDELLFYGDAGGKSLYQSAQGIIPPPARLVLAVGPEGGFDDREMILLQQCPRAIAISCGSLILRTETAGPALLSAVNQWLTNNIPTEC